MKHLPASPRLQFIETPDQIHLPPMNAHAGPAGVGNPFQHPMTTQVGIALHIRWLHRTRPRANECVLWVLYAVNLRAPLGIRYCVPFSRTGVRTNEEPRLYA